MFEFYLYLALCIVLLIVAYICFDLFVESCKKFYLRQEEKTKAQRFKREDSDPSRN